MNTIKRIAVIDRADGRVYNVELTHEYGQHFVGVVCGPYYASPSYWDMENALHKEVPGADLMPSPVAAKAIDAAIEKLEAMIPSNN